jgi:catechol 2,3-dioxygenase-like lactoylglutathione lyase family enzyme
MHSRRAFLAFTGGIVLASEFSWAEDNIPPLLDHVLLGCRDLDKGIAFFEGHSGVRAAIGGVHPGRGTRNALLSLGERRYLEIIAPDPEQKTLDAPRLITWAAHPSDIEALARKLHDDGIAAEGPAPGSRKRPDGRVLNWKSLSLADDHQGLIPFFIEWGAASPHPSMDAPSGCHLDRFAVAGPDPEELSNTFHRLGIDVPVERGERPQLRARFSGPKGKFDVTS